jgi:hypothetical protein
MAIKPKKITTEEAQLISVEIIKENKDGSANAQIKFNKQGLETLVQWGMVALLTAAIDEYKIRLDEDSEAVTKRTRPTTKKKVSKK